MGRMHGPGGLAAEPHADLQPYSTSWSRSHAGSFGADASNTERRPVHVPLPGDGVVPVVHPHEGNVITLNQ